jgi:hypothetical protein
VTEPSAPDGQLFADPNPPSPPPASPLATRGAALAIAAITFAVVLAIILVVRRPAPVPAAPDYSDATRTAFLAACTGQDTATAPTCACAYDKIRQTIPFDRYLALNAPSGTTPGSPGSPDSIGSPGSTVGTTPARLPDDLEVIVVGCIARASISGTTPPGTAPAGTSPAVTLELRPS